MTNHFGNIRRSRTRNRRVHIAPGYALHRCRYRLDGLLRPAACAISGTLHRVGIRILVNNLGDVRLCRRPARIRFFPGGFCGISFVLRGILPLLAGLLCRCNSIPGT
ncbi:hypothetical protein MUA01_16790 [Enterobacteriaceae bacterium H18W14]|uniref:hypothetical protein n=1 Tax=Dryocola boscaweniae TaxID=2925397 RepID=UPI0022F064F5|nr:hypothetical protein [Dryocola boscaweniae]MCT4716621.1 hypothetical protein [Dryocola boscaweniae]